MIYVKLRGGNDGCGVVGDNLARALQELAPTVRLGNEVPPSDPLPGPLLERVYRFERTVTATRNIAYCVFEDDIRIRRVGMRMSGVFDVIAPASRWCEAALRDAGLSSVTTVHQAVDGRRFSPEAAVRRRFHDRFVIYAGGKFELRKGQDLVVRAFQIFAQTHPDALLLTTWMHPWTVHIETMASSPHVPFQRRERESPHEALSRWLVEAGLNSEKVELVSAVDNADMARIYGDTDVGVFPSRCEGGTNLVMMEYMACGRPVIATDYSGHRDVLTDANSIPLRSFKLAPVVRFGECSGLWCEPDVDEIVAALEAAYNDRDELRRKREQAAKDLRHWTWNAAARRFLQLLEPGKWDAVDDATALPREDVSRPQPQGPSLEGGRVRWESA